MDKKYWQNKNVFITGAAGFLGSWLAQDLVNLGANVTVLIRDFEPNSNFYRFGLDKKVKIVNGDLRDYLLLERIFGEYEISFCFHLAAQPIVPIANRSPLSTFESNIKGTWNILEAARRSPLKPMLAIASSDKAYGYSDELPYREHYQIKGSHPYDVSKSCVDLLAQSYFSTYKLPLAIVRCGNFYGGGDLNWSRIIPGVMRSVIFDEDFVIRSDGKLIRDYIYVRDVANAYITLAEKMQDEKIHGEAFNFGTETPVSVLDLANKAIEVTGKNIKTKILGQNHGEIPEQYLSTEKARTVLGWRPTYSLEYGLLNTYEWYKSFFNK